MPEGRGAVSETGGECKYIIKGKNREEKENYIY